jgi:putative spermidine/putrescine transport system substrate-binding protein
MVKDGLLEPINYGKLDRAKLDRIPKPLHSSHGIGHKIYSFNIVYNTKTFPTGKHPRSWAEVWDGQKFKGGRSFNFRGGIGPQLELALLADGVTIDKLYPVDVERAWKSMDRVRPLVTKWYQSHAEAIQLVTAGEVDVACTIGPRAVTAKRTGAPIDVDYNEGKLGSDYWCVVKGSKNQEVALQFINFALDGKRQAGMVKENPYGPSNAAAFEFLTRDEARDLTTAPDNIKRQFWINEDWWGKVGADGKNENQKQKERFATWMLQK